MSHVFCHLCPSMSILIHDCPSFSDLLIFALCPFSFSVFSFFHPCPRSFSFSILGCPYPAHTSTSFCVFFRPLSMLVHSCLVSFFSCFHPFYDCIYPIRVHEDPSFFNCSIYLCPSFFLPVLVYSSFFVRVHPFPLLLSWSIFSCFSMCFAECVCVCNMCKFVSQLPVVHQGREKWWFLTEDDIRTSSSWTTTAFWPQNPACML